MIIADRISTYKPELIAQHIIPPSEENQPDTLSADLTSVGPAQLLDLEQPPVPFAGCSFCPPAPSVADLTSPPRILDYSWKLPLIAQMACCHPAEARWWNSLAGQGHCQCHRCAEAESKANQRDGRTLARRVTKTRTPRMRLLGVGTDSIKR
jgi:hypothetical protein